MPSRMAYSSATRLFRRLAAEAERRAVTPPITGVARRTRSLAATSSAGPAHGGAGVAAASALGPVAVRAARARDARVVVIGAGVAGLRCAHQLRQSGITAQVYEAAGRIGGRTFSVTDFFADGQVAEHGGEFISTEHNATRNLARNLGTAAGGHQRRRAARRRGDLPDRRRLLHLRGGERRLADRVEGVQGRAARRAMAAELQFVHAARPRAGPPVRPRVVRSRTSAEQPDPRRVRTAAHGSRGC